MVSDFRENGSVPEKGSRQQRSVRLNRHFGF